VAKPNYQFEKRQRELEKKRKKAEKERKKTADTEPAPDAGTPAGQDNPPPATGE
jgi:hypothetical protein